MWRKCLALVAISALVSAQNYCDPNLCPRGRTHIVCNHNGRFASNCDGTLIDMSPYRNQILQLHNERRNRIANGSMGFPSAVRMTTMSWDDELARIAAYNVLQCRLAHDECRNTPTYPTAGQNLAIYYSSRASVADVLNNRIASWFDEYRNANRNDLEQFRPTSGSQIGHFTTMVNERNDKVGCAVAKFTDPNRGPSTLLACNYAMTNLLNRPIYRFGPTGSECSAMSNRYPNLCTEGEPVDYDAF